MYIDQNRKWIVNGTDFGTVNANVLGTIDEDMIFGGVRSGYAIRLYRIKLYGLNGTLIRDLIPVRVGSGSSFEGAMLDTVERKVYRNAGTGSFIIGPEAT